MKQTPLQRKTELRRTGRRRAPRPPANDPPPRLDEIGEFHKAARDQVVCAVCGRGGHFDAHHVVEKSHLKNLGRPLWDRRNALRLCDRPDMGCHQQHTGAAKRVPLAKLTAENIEYAFETLGPGAYDYLKRRYTGDDPRVERKLKEAC